MIKRILGIILIIVIILIGIGYCSGKRSMKNEARIDLNQINSELISVDNELKDCGNNILTVWNNTLKNGSINKKEMASITNVPYNKFQTLTKEYNDETYIDGLKAARVEVAYYNNVGIFPDIKEGLNNIQTRLNDFDEKETQNYKNTLNKYNKSIRLLALLSNPSGNYNDYKNAIYANE
ncbi:MAG: hypothetical protein ACRDAU_17485 [Clostridium sp.]